MYDDEIARYNYCDRAPPINVQNSCPSLLNPLLRPAGPPSSCLFPLRYLTQSPSETTSVRLNALTSARCFFFSSRRRHTRCLSDWSSDVCSSDLEAVQIHGTVSRGLVCLLWRDRALGDRAQARARSETVVEGVRLWRGASACHPRAEEIGRASCRERV